MACKCRIFWKSTPYERSEKRSYEDDDGTSAVTEVQRHGITTSTEIEKCPECRYAREMRKAATVLMEEVEAIAYGEFGVDWADYYEPLFRHVETMKDLLATIEREERSNG